MIKEIAFESVFRIRISSGWKVKAIFGNYTVKTADLLSYLTDAYLILFINKKQNNSLWDWIRLAYCNRRSIFIANSFTIH